MVRPEFSEFSFAFAHLFDYIKMIELNTPGNVTIPSLRDEMKLGYDAKVDEGYGKFVYFQYKIANRLTRRNAKYWNYYNQQYYEIKIHKMKKNYTQNNQHNLLKKRADNGDLVYYVAQAFSEFPDSNLQSSFNTVNESIHLDLSDSLLPLIDSLCKTQHSITYTLGQDVTWNSEPKHLNDWKDQHDLLTDILMKPDFLINRNNLNNIRTGIENLLNISFSSFQFLQMSTDHLTQQILEILQVLKIKLNVITLFYSTDNPETVREIYLEA